MDEYGVITSIQTHINIAHHASRSHRGDMPAYIVVQISIHDPVTYEHYMKIAPPSIAAYGGRYVVRGGPSEVLEGSWQPKRH
jgi:hypothetical protein